MNSVGMTANSQSSPHTAILDGVVSEKTSALPNLPAPMHATIAVAAAISVSPKRIGYGLPCSQCGSYYAADLRVCPFCNAKERVLPAAVISGAAPALISPTQEQSAQDAENHERQNTLLELKVQAYASHTQIGAGASLFCGRKDQHVAESASAAVCQDCYDLLQDKVTRLESALAMGAEEASQVIYDAVWADPSDPNKTYLNAAHAVLAELAKRAGIVAG